eukprot:GILI01019010.1.p1 GENE.GILI01019010.1~~GILI01019010.1.p1  ORF type:complete len:541 (-),score=44.55 GILI01019010.1:218-1840(-)
MLLEFENAFSLLGQEFIMTNVYASLAAHHLKLLSSCRAIVPAEMLQLFPQQTKLVSDVATCYQLSFPQQPGVVATGLTPAKEPQMEPSLLFSSIAVQKIISAVIDPYQAQLFLDLTMRQSSVTLLKVVLATWAVQENYLNPTRSSPIIHDYTSGSNTDERRGDDEFDPNNVTCVIVKPKRDFKLNTLLHLACELGLTPVVEFLLDTVIKQQAEGHYGRACGTFLDSNSNLAKGVKVLLDLAPGHSAALSPLLTVVEARNQDRMSALQLAIRSTAALTAPDVVRLLLVKGSASMSSYETFYTGLQLRENVRTPSYFTHTKSLPTSQGKVKEGIVTSAKTGFLKSLPYPTKTNANTMNVAFAVASFGNLEALVDGLCSREYEQSAERIPSSLVDGTLVAFLWRATQFIRNGQVVDAVQQKQYLSILRKLVALGCSLNISPDLPTLYQLKADTNLDPMNPQDMNVPPFFLAMVVALLTRNPVPVSGFGGGIPQVSSQLQTFGNELVTILLDAGADPDEKDRSGSPISALWPTGDIMRYRKLVA